MSEKKYVIEGKEVVAWITRGGKRIPIFDDENIKKTKDMTDEETKDYINDLYNKLEYSQKVLPQNRIAKDMLLSDLHATREAMKLADIEGLDKTSLTNLSIYVDDKILKNGGTANDYLEDRIISLRENIKGMRTRLDLEKRKSSKDYIKETIRRDELFIDETEKMIKRLRT